MADHVRKSIRAAVVAALTNLTTTGSRVFPGRVYPLETADLPGLLIYTDGEDVRTGSMGVSRQLERTLEVTVEAVFQDLTSLDDVGDEILLEVETALGAPGVALGGLKSLTIARIDNERSDDGDKPTERRKMIFRGFYSTAQGAPTIAL